MVSGYRLMSGYRLVCRCLDFDVTAGWINERPTKKHTIHSRKYTYGSHFVVFVAQVRFSFNLLGYFTSTIVIRLPQCQWNNIICHGNQIRYLIQIPFLSQECYPCMLPNEILSVCRNILRFDLIRIEYYGPFTGSSLFPTLGDNGYCV